MSERRNIKFNSVGEVLADLEKLRRGHKAIGNWTLPQASWHLKQAVHHFLKPVAQGAISTTEQKAAKASRIDPLLAAGVMPTKIPTPPGGDPLRDAPMPIDDAEVEHYAAGLRDLQASPLKEVEFARFGILSIDEFRKFVCIHAANHHGNFIPTT